ncbi:flagellar basal body rod protein FlgC, partial [Micrococcus sp. SIMBA_144]
VVSSNIANAETTRSELVDGEWQPYKRKVVELEENSFESKLQKAMGNEASSTGVKVSNVQEDNAPNKLVYNPAHPDANEEGYVEMPNVDMV